MKRNINSIPARLYRDFYAFEGCDEMPKSLCPYFWKLMLMWICILPLALFSIVGFIFEICEFLLKRKKQNMDFPLYTSKDRSLGSLAIYIILVLLYCMVLSIVGVFHHFSYDNADGNTSLFGAAHYMGNTINIMLLIGLIGWFFGRKGGPLNEPIVSTYIKAKYRKVCPKIDWENK